MPRQRPQKRSRLASLAVRSSQKKRAAAERAAADDERMKASIAVMERNEAEIQHLRVTLESLQRDYEEKENQCRKLEKDVETLNFRDLDLAHA